MINTDGNGE
jgi:kinesin family member 15